MAMLLLPPVHSLVEPLSLSLSGSKSMEVTSKETISPSEEGNKKEALSSESQWRAYKTLEILYTRILNRQLHRRWVLEQSCIIKLPPQQRFRQFTFLEPIPPLTRWSKNDNDLQKLKIRVRYIKARVEKCKELASEIERRMRSKRIRYPTHFCHTCLSTDGVFLTKCGHRVCLTCVSCSTDKDGGYECCICFARTSFVPRIRCVGLG